MVLPLTGKSKEFINELLPWQSHFAQVAGFQMHYIDEGPREPGAPVVILLHGNPTWCFYYRHVIEALRSRFRVIVPDYIGMGLSERPLGRHFRAEDRIDHAEELVKLLGLKRFSLVMHDWGGPIGTGLAQRNIAAVERLVYLNTTLTETESLPGIIKTAARPIIGRYLTMRSMRFLKLMTSLGVCRKLSRRVKEAYYYPYLTSARRAAIWDFVADIPFDSDHASYASMLQMADRLPQMRHIPVQIIWGLRDPCFHRAMLDKVAGHFPQASILEIPDASHLLLEDAHEQACEVIHEFLLNGRGTGIVRKSQPAGESAGINALYEAFQTRAEENPQSDAAVVPYFFFGDVNYQRTNYRDLRMLVDKYRRGLVQLGLAPGDRVLMLVPPGIEFLALSYAVMGCGAVPAFVDPGMGRDNLFKCIASLKPAAMIGSPRAQLLRLRRRRLFPQLKFHVTASNWIYTGGPNLSYLKKFSFRALPAAPSQETNLIAFTSGGTGTPKGVIFTAQMLKEQLRIFREDFGLEAGQRDMPLLPVFSLFNLACGICSVFAPIDTSHPLTLAPNQIVRIVNDLGVDSSFGSPTLWNKISEYCSRAGESLPSLRRVFMAGAPVSTATIERVRDVTPNSQAFTPYGATEALPVTLVSAQELLQHRHEPARSGEQGVYVGKSIPADEVRIIAAVDGVIEDISQAQALPACEIGEIIVKGKNISPAYFELPEGTAAAKIADRDGFWHRMGDVGYLNEAGGLYFCGRKAHCVRSNGKVFYSVPVEHIFNQHSRVKRSALVACGREGEPAIVIEPYPQHWPETEEARRNFVRELRELAASSPLTVPIRRVFFHPAFPVDARHNAKIFRDKLGTWAGAQPWREEEA